MPRQDSHCIAPRHSSIRLAFSSLNRPGEVLRKTLNAADADLQRTLFTAQCTIVQSGVLRLYVVCLSVCL